jgi:Zn-dependent peptidase ImmA (M78 family)
MTPAPTRNDGRGARVADLRRLFTITQSQLADITGVPQPNLSDIERGRSPLTEGVAYRICRATGTPMEFFSFAAPGYDEMAIHFRKSKRVSARGRDFVLQAFKEIERISGRLAEAPVRLRRVNLPVAEAADVVSDDDIEAVSLDARRASRIGDEEPVRNVMRTIERAGVAVAPLSIPRGSDNDALLHGHCGMSRWDGDAPCATVTYVTGLPGDRLRFTLAHELGHVLLHTRRSLLSEKEREREADLFAGAFLVPRSVAEKTISETLTLHGFMRMKAQFGVAIQALIMRGRKAGLISQQRQRSLMIQVSSRGWRTSEPVHVGCEAPLLLWTQLAAVHGSNPYFPASKAYGVPPGFLEQWVPARPVKGRRSTNQAERPNVIVALDEHRAQKRMDHP